MNAQGRPARVDSPWIERKISVMRSFGPGGSGVNRVFL
jgi:protein subunit release factor B